MFYFIVMVSIFFYFFNCAECVVFECLNLQNSRGVQIYF